MTIRALAPVLFAACGLAQTLPGVDPGLLNLVMPDAKVLSGIQVDQSLASPFGRYVLSQMQPNDPGFLQFITATGFDPTKNLTQILMATGASVDQNNVLVLGRGTFVPTQIASAAIAQGGSVTTYNGVSLITGPGNASNTSLAFPDNSTATIGSVAMVEAAIDRYQSKATYSGNLAAPALAVSTANSAWFATETPLSDFLSGKVSGQLGSVSQNNLFQAITAASGGITFGASSVTVTGDAVTTSAQNAQALVDVLKFLVSMVQSNANNQAVNTVANAATFTANGATTHMSLSLPEQQAEQLFMLQGQGQSRPMRRKPVQ